jgi:glycosyltransferase involved in cell wall biosynthesis
MKPVTLSVCIPVFNCREHIARAVDSVLAQSFSDFELIIVDNCSNDGTYELLCGYTDPRIRLLRNATNIGACGNWNRVLMEASGRYIKILCADDLLYPDCLQRQISVLEAEDEAVMMVSCGRDIVDEKGRRVFRRQYPGSGGRVAGRKVIRKIVLHGTNIIGDVSSVIIRRGAITKAGEFDGSLPYVIDLDYWVRVLQNGDLFVMSEYLSAYRVSGASWSVAIAASQTANFSALIIRINQVYGIELTRLEMLVGNIMARLNSLLRKIFYRIYLRR